MLSAAGAAPQLLNDAISTGVITGAETYPEQTVSLLRTLVALDRHGIEPRHVRSLRQSAEREAALVESALSALLRRPDAASRARASELAPELAARWTRSGPCSSAKRSTGSCPDRDTPISASRMSLPGDPG